jgi:hypothetical protein
MSEYYRDLNTALRERFGCRVQRVPVDAGFTCPNRDGSIGTGGCIYCSPRGSGAYSLEPDKPVQEQLEQGIRLARHMYRAEKFIAYFQAFSNTYVPPSHLTEGIHVADVLRRIYAQALDYPDVVGIAIGTRPDCLPDDVIAMLGEIAEHKLVWLELGLQSSHDATLELIKRGHTYADFEDAVMRVRRYCPQVQKKDKTSGLELIAHIILGLPGETREMMLQTAREVARLGLEGIKIHLLHVVKDTVLEGMYRRGEVDLLEVEQYVGLVCDILEVLPPSMVIHRVTGEAAKEELIAPQWALDKARVVRMIDEELTRRDTHQGAKYCKQVSRST